MTVADKGADGVDAAAENDCGLLQRKEPLLDGFAHEGLLFCGLLSSRKTRLTSRRDRVKMRELKGHYSISCSGA